MADAKSNGNGNGVVAALEFEKSVKKADFNDSAGLFNYFVPAYGFYGRDYVALPQYLPASNSGFYYHTERDAVLMSTIDHEGVWANAVNIATQKAASWGWEVTSEIALRQKRAQELIQDFEWLGIVDYTTAISAHIKGYLLTGRAFIEIERTSSSRFSKVVALHHLDPLACRLTGNPDKPVCYMDTKSQVHELNSWEVGIFVMNPSPIERPFFNFSRPFQSAAESVYDQITQMEAIWKYLYEKTTGKRALAIDFVTGISHKNLADAIISSDADMERKGGQLFKGSILIPIVQADSGISHVRIDLAGLPDGFDFQKMYDNTLITYCGALGLDVNDLDPRLAQRQSLGSGTQAELLDAKTNTKGMVVWRQQFLRFINRMVLDSSTSISWRDRSVGELTKEAEMKGKIIANVSAMLKDQIITNPQALNILVDEEVLPREFLDTDLTQANSIGDDEKDIAQPRDPNAPKPETATDSEVIPQGTNTATSQPASNGGNTIPSTSAKAWRTYKHLPGRHNQRNHGNRGDKPAVGSDKHNAQQQVSSGGGATGQQATPTQNTSPVSTQGEVKPVSKPVAQPLPPSKGQYADFGTKVAKGSEVLVNSQERKEWKEGLSKDEEEAIGTYTSSDYQRINTILRDGRNAGGWQKTIDNLDQAIDSSVTPFDVSVYRGCRNAPELKNFFLSQAKVGGEWSDPSYMSTSLDKHSFGAFKGADVSFKINVPKGSKAAFLNGDLSIYPNEAEMILPRGAKFRIDRIVKNKYGGHTDGGTVEITLTVIP